MPRAARRVGETRFKSEVPCASDWKSLSEWKRDEIPPYPGFYEIRFAPDGVPYAFQIDMSTPTTSRLTPEEAERRVVLLELVGTLYIGKAVSLADRFWHLIEAWLRNDEQADNCKNHGSYNKWLKKNYQQDYPVRDLQFRYTPKGSEIWRPEIIDEVDAIRAALMKQDGTAPDNLATSAAFAEENIRLRLYEQYFGIGKTPPLNTYGRGKKKMKASDRDAHFAQIGDSAPATEVETEFDLQMEDAYTNPVFLARGAGKTQMK